MIGLLAPVSQCFGYSVSEGERSRENHEACPLHENSYDQGSMYHNKFLLTVHAAFDFILLLMQFSIGFSLLELSIPIHGAEVRDDCVMSQPEAPGSCDDYIQSAAFIGFKLVWAARFNVSMATCSLLLRPTLTLPFLRPQLVNVGDPSEYATMITWQRSGGCCGYGPPLNCQEDSQSIPPELSLEGVPEEYAAQATTCGAEGSWYPVSGLDSNLCEQPIDKTAAVLKYGGCQYDMPLGQCKESTPLDTDRG